MEELIIFILSTAGLSWIVVKSKIFKSLREKISSIRINSPNFVLNYLDQVLNCSGCFGVWSGIISYMLVYQVVTIEAAAFACSGSIISMMSDKLLKHI